MGERRGGIGDRGERKEIKAAKETKKKPTETKDRAYFPALPRRCRRAQAATARKSAAPV